MTPTLRELESVCQKPEWRTAGSLLARRVARPFALYVTWVVVRLPISANAVTAATLVVGIAAAWLVAMPGRAMFLGGAIVLNLWYLLDHVDGQVARFHRAGSITGVYFDFMMHHVVHAACAFALGFGVAARTGQLAWTLAGAGFALGLMLLSLMNDCRYKAFFAALATRSPRLPPRPDVEDSKGTRGRERRAGRVFETHHVLEQTDGGSRRLDPPYGYGAVARAAALVYFVCRKLCEMPNVIIAVSGLAVMAAIRPATGLGAVAVYALVMSVLAPAVAVARVAKDVWCRRPDAEFREFMTQVSR